MNILPIKIPYSHIKHSIDSNKNLDNEISEIKEQNRVNIATNLTNYNNLMTNDSKINDVVIGYKKIVETQQTKANGYNSIIEPMEVPGAITSQFNDNLLLDDFWLTINKTNPIFEINWTNNIAIKLSKSNVNNILIEWVANKLWFKINWLNETMSLYNDNIIIHTDFTVGNTFRLTSNTTSLTPLSDSEYVTKAYAYSTMNAKTANLYEDNRFHLEQNQILGKTWFFKNTVLSTSNNGGLVLECSESCIVMTSWCVFRSNRIYFY